MAYRNRDVESGAIGFLFLWGGMAAVGVGGLAGIGAGGYFLGKAIGLVGMSAFGGGVGIIVGGLLVLTGIGFGIYGIVNACIKAHQKSKVKNEMSLTAFNTNRADQIYDSTKTILRSTSSNKISQEMTSVKNVEQPQVIHDAAPAKQSFWSRLFGRRSSMPACSSDDALCHSEIKYPSA